MFSERKLDQLDRRASAASSLPLRLQLWNGQQFDLGKRAAAGDGQGAGASAPCPTCSMPSLYNLGKRLCRRQLEVEGRVSRHDRRRQCAGAAWRASGQPRGAPGACLSATPARRTPRRSATTTTCPTSSTKLWLDPNMVYSCAYFENGDEDLATAQIKKIDHILTKIQVQPGQPLLDIGCGWGALVIRAAQKFGARCVGVTLSENQFELAHRARASRPACRTRSRSACRITATSTAQFDRITSVGMFEHVGRSNLPRYFGKMQHAAGRRRRRDEPRHHDHRHRTAATRPTAAANSSTATCSRTASCRTSSLVLKAMQQGGLEALDVENLRRHYARTCAIWADNFEAQCRAKSARLVDDEEIPHLARVPGRLRLCVRRTTGSSLYQIVCRKAGRSATALPWSRRYMYPRRQGTPIG